MVVTAFLLRGNINTFWPDGTVLRMFKTEIMRSHATSSAELLPLALCFLCIHSLGYSRSFVLT